MGDIAALVALGVSTFVAIFLVLFGAYGPAAVLAGINICCALFPLPRGARP